MMPCYTRWGGARPWVFFRSPRPLPPQILAAYCSWGRRTPYMTVQPIGLSDTFGDREIRLVWCGDVVQNDITTGRQHHVVRAFEFVVRSLGTRLSFCMQVCSSTLQLAPLSRSAFWVTSAHKFHPCLGRIPSHGSDRLNLRSSP